MQITEAKVKVSDLCKGYSDNGDGGVYDYDGRLTMFPRSCFMKQKGGG